MPTFQNYREHYAHTHTHFSLSMLPVPLHLYIINTDLEELRIYSFYVMTFGDSTVGF